MKIIIIGCGKVGYALAEGLTAENHDVTIVDTSAEQLQSVTEELDAMPVVGNGASISTLFEAGIIDTDLLIAVTGSDELNLLCCLIAKQQWDCHTVARVRNPIYSREIDLIKKSLGISMIINPELAASAEIARLLRFPSAIKIDTFAKGRVELLKFRVKPEFHLDQVTIAELPRHTKCDVLVAGVERGDQAYIPNGNFVLQNEDLVSIVASPQNAAGFFQKIGLKTNQATSCLIIGGGTIAVYLSRLLLDMKIRVNIIEQDLNRCQQLSELLPDATIIHGDGTNRKLLQEENLERAEAFAALTNMDEENIMLSLFAKEHSKAKLITKVNRMSFDNVLDKLDLGSIIYPKYITVDYILQYIRAMQNSMGSNVETLYHILDNKAEALEFNILEPSGAVGIPLKDMRLKKNLLLCCINRRGRIIIPRGNDSIEVGDTVIVVTTQKGLGTIADILER